MSVRFNNAISALVKAFFNGTLAKGTCTACAIGNIVGAARGSVITIKHNIVNDGCDIPCQSVEVNAYPSNDHWGALFATTCGEQNNGIKSARLAIKDKDVYRGSIIVSNGVVMPISKEQLLLAFEDVELTGYDAEELALVEYAFETNTSLLLQIYYRKTKDEIIQDQYNGLMACFEVLCEIEGFDKEPYQKLLAYNDEFKPVNELVLV